MVDRSPLHHSNHHRHHCVGLIENDELKEALQGFQQVLSMEESKGEWGFKALKQIVKLQYRLEDHPAMLEAYKQLLSYANTAGITKNAAEKKINSVLDFISQSTDSKLLQDFYGITLNALVEANNERLWFKTNVKLANLWLSLGKMPEAAKVLRELHNACQDASGVDDQRKGTQLLEVYALQIQLHTEQRNSRRLKELYRKALAIKSAIPHPRIMGIIRECGGKMHTLEREWAEAATDFFEAFKSYDEAGSAARTRCLRYLVLANMLMESEVDPFDSQEAKPYRSDPEVAAMTSLVEAYQSGDIKAFEQVLRTNKKMIEDDPFVAPYIDDLKKNVRTQVVLRSIAAYTRVKVDHIAAMLNTSVTEVEQLLIGLILDGKVSGRIDQVNKVLELEVEDEQAEKYQALRTWADQLHTLNSLVVNRLAV